MRYGAITTVSARPDPNSLLHCILTAIAEPYYSALVTGSEREEYVKSLRRKLPKSIHPEILKQELHDVDLEIYLGHLGNPDVYLDPRLYYRVFEELYNINIFVFFQSRSDVDSIDIPRSRNFHIRPKRVDRMSVIIIKHFGSKNTANSPFPQCELIVEVEDGLIKDMLFNSKMTNLLYQILDRSAIVVTWSFFEMLTEYNQIYNQINYSHLLGVRTNNTPIMGQYIDDYGKTRALVILTDAGGVSAQVTLMIPPIQPFNLPSLTIDKLPLCRYQDALALMGNSRPSAMEVIDDAAVGIWFEVLGVRYHTYIPIFPTEGLNYELGPSSPIILRDQYTKISTSRVRTPGTPGTSSTLGSPKFTYEPASNLSIDLINRLKRTLSITLQLIHWVFNLQRFERSLRTANQPYIISDVPGLEENFITTYFDFNAVDPTDYDYSRLEPILSYFDPVNVTDPKQKAMEHIRQYTNLVIETATGLKFRFPSQNLAIKVANEVRTYYRDNFGAVIRVPRSIQGYYSTYVDFQTDYDVKNGIEIFIGREDLDIWLESHRKIYDPTLVYQQLTADMAKSVDPVVYEDDDGKIYMIQNTRTGTLDRATDIANVWVKDRINMGYNYVDPDMEKIRQDAVKRGVEKPVLAYLLWGISSAGRLILVDDKTGGSQIYSNILTYTPYSPTSTSTDTSQGKFAALLELATE
jgi:hypothetical protein